jgi:hypothetical protein
MFLLRSLILCLFCCSSVVLADTALLTAGQYIAAMKAAAPQGGVYIRAKMETRTAAGQRESLQIQIKRRELTGSKSECFYQILSPKGRRGEGLILRMNGRQFSAVSYTPATGISALKLGDRSQKVLSTDLTLDEIISDFLDWPQQKILGQEVYERKDCAVLESSNGVAKVKTWIDMKRYVSVKAEMYSAAAASEPMRTVITEDTMRTDQGYYIPTQFQVTTQATGSVTRVEGASGCKTGIQYSDADFSDAALQQITPPPSK